MTCNSFPNISIALRIMLTMPMTTAITENKNSQTTIRCTIASISIENLNYGDLIVKFQKQKR